MMGGGGFDLGGLIGGAINASGGMGDYDDGDYYYRQQQYAAERRLVQGHEPEVGVEQPGRTPLSVI